MADSIYFELADNEIFQQLEDTSKGDFVMWNGTSLGNLFVAASGYNGTKVRIQAINLLVCFAEWFEYRYRMRLCLRPPWIFPERTEEIQILEKTVEFVVKNRIEERDLQLLKELYGKIWSARQTSRYNIKWISFLKFTTVRKDTGRDVSAIDKLAKEAGVSKEKAKAWLKKQTVWQIYLPSPKYIPRAKFSVSAPNEVHQADLLFLLHDRPGKGKKLYKYALTVVDVASRYKEADPLSSKESGEVAKAFEKIYSRVLKWPKLLQVDPGREFMGKVNEVMKKHNVSIKRGEAAQHRAQAIVERFNRTLAERLFGHQYAQEIVLAARGGKNVRSTEWVSRLPNVVKALDNEETRLIGMKPVDAIKKKEVKAMGSAPQKLKNEIQIPGNVKLRYLYAPGELEGGERRRATDPNWSLETYTIDEIVKTPGDPILYYLSEGAPKRGFVRQELMFVPEGTMLPPDQVLK